jgi:hypothetical protein
VQTNASGTLNAWNAHADGSVRALVTDAAGSLYVGGYFTQLGGQARSYLAKLDQAASATAWDASADAGVSALGLDELGNLYVGGYFQQLNGSNHLGIARLDGAANAGGLSLSAGMTGTVSAIARQSDGKIVVGGYFSMAGTEARSNLLRLNPDGTLDSWDPNSDGPVSALAVEGVDNIYASGYFTKIGGQPRSYLAQLNAITGAATTWDANPDEPVIGLAMDNAGHVYASGPFCDIGGQSRCNFAQLDHVTGAATTWDFQVNGSVNAVVADGAGNLFVGGWFTQIGGQSRNNIAKFNIASALASSWDANSGTAVGVDDSVYSLAIDQAGKLVVGGRFSSIGGQARNNLAKIDALTGAVSAWNPNPNGVVFSLVAEGSGTIYAGGTFTHIGGQTRNHLAQLFSNAVATSWNPDGNGPVIGLALGNSGEIFAAGEFSTIGGQSRYQVAALAAGVPDSQPPDPPTDVNATAAGTQKVTVSFTIPVSDGGSPILTYKVIPSHGNVTASGTSSPITLNGLNAGFSYSFTVTATNAAGTSLASVASNSVLVTGLPDPPTIGNATAGNSAAQVSFSAPDNTGGLAINAYTITSSPGGITASGPISPIDVPNLINGTDYTFTVTATNDAGTSIASAASNHVTPATLPGAPTIGVASAGNGQATVRFTAPESNGGSAITAYTVTASTGGFGTTGSVSPIVVKGLTNGTAYTFHVTATNNSVGTGPASGESNSVTPSASLANLTSRFFIGDVTAEQVMAGTPFNMNDPAWITNTIINRNLFAYKVFAALFMLGYQTEMGFNYYQNDEHLRAIKAFQSNNGRPISNTLDAATLTLIDLQVAQRVPLLASIATDFPIYGHLVTLAPNEVSKDTVASIFALPMKALPPYLQLTPQEFADCTAGQCVGFIRDATNTTDLQSPIDLSSNFVFVGHYFDPKLGMPRLPSAAVLTSTVLHEFAHYLNGSNKMIQYPHMGIVDTTDFYALSYDLNSTNSSGCMNYKVDNPMNWLSRYGYMGGTGCPQGMHVGDEDWAESFSFYVSSGRDFRAAAQVNSVIAQKYEWLRTNVFFGLEYDTDLPADTFEGCADIYWSDLSKSSGWNVPGYLHCNDQYIYNFTLPKLPLTSVTGACGASDGGIFASVPSKRLCASGQVSAVSGSGPWQWSCQGFNGGGDSSCSATKGTQSIVFGSAPTVLVGGTGIIDVTGGLSGNPVLLVSYTPDVCSVSGNSVTGIGVGQCALWANQAGNSQYAAADPKQYLFRVVMSQTIGSISFAPATLAVGGSTTASATGGASGNAVTFSSSTSSSICTVSSGGIVTGVGVGVCVVAADQTGNTNYMSATQVTQSITVKSHQTIGSISFTPAILAVGGTTAASATGGASGNAVTFSSGTSSSICTVSSSGTVTGVGIGACLVAADQAGSTNYLAATQVTKSITVAAAPVVTLNPMALKFGEQHIGSTSTIQTVVVSNTGGSAFTFASIVSTGDFSASGCGGTLGAGASCSLSVTFTPTAPAGRVGSVRVTGNATNSPQSVILNGTGMLSNAPICVLRAAPSKVKKNGTSILTPTCTPMATTYLWAGGTCKGTTLPTCTVTPAVTTTYSVTGTNQYGFSTASADVAVKTVDLTPILMLLMD